MKLYGSPMSRAARCLWAMEELGLQYELIPTQPFAETHTPEFLKINPNGHIPVLEDQGKIFGNRWPLISILQKSMVKANFGHLLWKITVIATSGVFGRLQKSSRT